MNQPWSAAFAGWLTGVAGFQTALALGAPWGAAAWGGGHRGVLPRHLRAASTAGAVGWVAAAAVTSGIIGGETARRRVVTGTTTFAGLSVLLNAASRSPVERAVWAPLAALGTVLGVLAIRETSRS